MFDRKEGISRVRPDISVGLSDDGAAGDSKHSAGTARIAWLDVFETGDAELDAWHQSLIRDCKSIMRAVATCEPWTMIVAKSELLVASCLDHFRFEEAIMARVGFPRRESHAVEHRKIAADLQEVVTKIRNTDGAQPVDRDLPRRFSEILIDLLVRHDLDYRSHLQSQLGR